MFNYYILQICLNVKKARNTYNNDGRGNKRNRSSILNVVMSLLTQKEIDYIKRNDFKLNIFLGGLH